MRRETSGPAGTPPVRVLGLMSGTSYDAIDVAAAEFDLAGRTLRMRPLGALSVPYPPGVAADIGALLPPAPTSIEAVCRLTVALGDAYADAAARGLRELCAGRADLVVSHGQTVYHWVADGRARGSLQLDRPATIAARTGLPVLSDLRSADIAAGGQGAPLVPVFDALLLAGAPGAGRRAALNLGGIANLTIVGGGAAGGVLDGVLGYDTGPANALIDAACRRFFGSPYDADGRHAANGRVDGRLLSALLREPYYAAPAPKSTGKELFGGEYLDRFLTGDESAVDVVATLTELTARTVADQVRAHRVDEVFAAGGGLRNPVLVDRLAAAVAVPVHSVTEFGVDADAKEAYAFALLGWLGWHGLPGAVPSVTGARRAAVLGSLTPGRHGLPLPPPLSRMPHRLRLTD